jgi:hypothetical protein
MPQENLIKIKLKDFTSLRNWELDSEIPPNCLFDSLNSEFDGGIWKSIQGVSGYLSPLTGGTSVRGLFYYPYKLTTGTTKDYLVEYYDKKFYIIDLATDTRTLVAGTTFTVDEDLYAIPYNNAIYFISPNNGIGYIENGGTWGSTFVGTPPVGSMVEVAFEKMWSAGDPLNQNLLTYGRTATASDPTQIRDYQTGSGKILIGSGGIITALKKLKNTMYVFKDEAIEYLTGFNTSGTYPVPLFDPYSVTGGALNPQCVVQVENDLWFLNKNLQLRSLGAVAQYISDSRTSDVSLAIKRFLNELDPIQPYAAMSYFKNVLKVTLRTNGSTWNNWTLIYDFNNGGYHIERLKPVKAWASSPDQRFFIESTDNSGKIFKDAIGYSMDGSPFSFNGKTRMVDGGDPTINKRIRYVKIYCGRSEGMELNMAVYKDSYGNAASSTKTLIMPTTTEMGSATTTGGSWGEEDFGEEVWGGSGVLGMPLDLPVFRKVFPVDLNLTGRMFGIEISGTINGTRAEIYMIELGLIPLPDKNIYTTN